MCEIQRITYCRLWTTVRGWKAISELRFKTQKRANTRKEERCYAQFDTNRKARITRFETPIAKKSFSNQLIANSEKIGMMTIPYCIPLEQQFGTTTEIKVTIGIPSFQMNTIKVGVRVAHDEVYFRIAFQNSTRGSYLE